MKEIRTRIAPSPTGYPHIGTIYQVMFDYVLAKAHDGKFLVRIEDTDRNRFVEGAEEVVFSSLEWFGLKPDEDPVQGGPYAPYRQSERLPIYKEYVQKLIDESHAYYCFCTKERLDEMRKKQESEKKPPMYDKTCMNLSEEVVAEKLNSGISYVVRMKIPENQEILVKDVILGEVKFDSNLVDHQVILKADGFPTYHLAVVVDDYLMKISHIIRGQEWLSSTPKHVLLYEYFGWEKEIPQFVHLPVILNTEGGGKLSKRHGHASVDYYKNEGYLPEAVLNYLANIVWNHPEGIEIFPLMDLAKAFELDSENRITHVQIYSQGPRFDLQKLLWMNGEYIRAMSDEELTKRLSEFLVDHPEPAKIAPLVPLVKERIKKLSDFIPLTNFVFEKPEYDMSAFSKIKIENMKEILKQVKERLVDFEKPWDSQKFEETFRKMAEDNQIQVRDMFQLLRAAVSGQLVTPPLFETIQIMGEDEVIQRIQTASEFLH
jgi:glutamyl-tRNA synthetase